MRRIGQTTGGDPLVALLAEAIAEEALADVELLQAARAAGLPVEPEAGHHCYIVEAADAATAEAHQASYNGKRAVSNLLQRTTEEVHGKRYGRVGAAFIVGLQAFAKRNAVENTIRVLMQSAGDGPEVVEAWENLRARAVRNGLLSAKMAGEIAGAMERITAPVVETPEAAVGALLAGLGIPTTDEDEDEKDDEPTDEPTDEGDDEGEDDEAK